MKHTAKRLTVPNLATVKKPQLRGKSTQKTRLIGPVTLAQNVPADLPGRRESGTDFLPCLNSHISIENHLNQSESALLETAKKGVIGLSTNHRKSAFILGESVQKLSNQYGLENLGFLTLTFREHITCPKEAQRRLNSIISNKLKERYREYLGVFERQKSGRVHYHLLVVVGSDIRTGFKFDEIENQNYTSASQALRREWAFLRKTAKEYGFGRTELLPIKSTTEAIGKYVGKYIAKHCSARVDEDKGIRLVRYSRGARAGTNQFQFNSNGSKEWRRKVAIFAQILQQMHPETKINTLADISRVLDKRWAYHSREFILAIP